MKRIQILEDALTHLTEGEVRAGLTSAEHGLIRQAQAVIDGEVDVPRSYGSKQRRGDQQRAARQQQQTRAALGLD